MTSVTVDLADGLNSAVAVKGPVVAATSANITLSGEQTISGVAVVEDDRVLVTSQTDATENGIYRVSLSTWTRTKDFRRNDDVISGTIVVVSVTGQIFKLSIDDDFEFDVDDVEFEEISATIETDAVVDAASFGATGDGSTDDAPSIQAAIDSLTRGGVVRLGRGTFMLDSTLTATVPGIRIVGQGAGNVGNLAPSVEAPTKVVIRQNTGAGIWLKGMSSGVSDLRLTSDTTRAAAAFDITKPGIRIEAADTSTALANRCAVERVRIDNQPGDGVLTNGPVTGSRIVSTDIFECMGMGIRCDNGSYTGITRTNKLYPGLIDIQQVGIGFCGGNAVAISNPTVTTQAGMGIRCIIDQLDCFGCANDAAVRYDDYAVWAFWENSTIQHSGIGGSGWNGSVLTNEVHGGIWAAGRDIRLVNNRYIETTQPVTVGYIAAQPTVGVRVEFGRVSNAALTIAEAVEVEAGAKGIHVNLEYWNDFTLPVTPNVEGVTWEYRGYRTSTATARVIASGVITVYENEAIARGEGAVLDDLISIVFGETAAIPARGAKVTLYNDQAYTITIKHASGGGNIRTNTGGDVAMATNRAFSFISDGTRMIMLG
jgi:hypothetical protein